MHSLESKLNIEIKPTPTLDSLKTLLNPLGLTPDPRTLPLFSLLDLFESFLKERRISKSSITKKIIALSSFLVSNPKDHCSDPFITSLSTHKDKIAQDSDPANCFYNPTVLNLFSYAFGLRLELYYQNQDRTSVQYFGFRDKPVHRTFIASDCYIVLKTLVKKSETQNSGSMSKSLSPVNSFNRLKSYMTMTTRAAETDNFGLEFNSGLGGYNRPGDNTDNLNSCNQSRFNLTNKNTTETIKEENLNNQLSALSSLQHYQRSISAHLPIHQNPAADLDSGFSVTGSETPTPSPPLKLAKNSVPEGKFIGRLKFYNETKEYGFILMDDDSEIFVHKADLVKQNIDTRYLAYYKKFYEIFLEFGVQEYQGKARKHRKAVDVLIYDMQTVC